MRRIAILIEDLFDDKELIYPYYRMQEAGFTVDLIGSMGNNMYKSKFGMPIKSDLASKDISASDYEAVIIPGGFSPDYMRRTQATIDFVRAMDTLGKPIASICHGPWLMISACQLKGKHLTGFHSIKVDIENAGASYLDQAVVIDGHLITSRTPADLPLFVKTLIDKLH
jgi:protease I